MLVSLSDLAHAAVTSCAVGDAPSGYGNQSCSGVCTGSGSELVCEMDTLCTGIGSMATVVKGYGASTHDLSAWGECFNGTKFCCVFDEGATNVTSVELNGTDYTDEALAFTYDLGGANERNLQPWDADPVEGYIRGNAGDDLIRGSNYAAVDYDESLYGQNGPDAISGNAGGDFISGGDGDDYIDGNAGNDQLWGGDGDDFIDGGADNDKLCDASGYDFCASDKGNELHGGMGDDTLWYEESENPNVPCPNIRLDFDTSDAGSGSNACGDNSNYSAGELPQSCGTYITTKPAKCEGAN